MKKEALYEAFGEIREDYIAEAHENTVVKRDVWLRWGAVAACVCLIAVAAFNGFSHGNMPVGPVGGTATEDTQTDDTNTPHGVFLTLRELNRPYRDADVGAGENMVAWKWEYLTVYEKYMEIYIDGVRYSRLGGEIDEAVIGARVGTYEAVGYNDPYDTPEGGYRENFDAYEIKGVSRERMVALKMEDNYYCFISEEARGEMRQMTWGEVLDAYGLADAIPFGAFSKYAEGEETAYFSLNDDRYLWEVLSSCKDAPYVDPREWQRDSNYLSFTVTTDVFGIYKKALYITESGYLWTNFLDAECVYHIGVDAAYKIISHAMENSTARAFEPYRESLVGTVTEITDTYVLVNDGVRCETASDGITFKILLNDLRINRYIDDGRVKVGDFVMVTYEGVIHVDNGYVIDSATSMNEAFIFGEDIMIPE